MCVRAILPPILLPLTSSAGDDRVVHRPPGVLQAAALTLLAITAATVGCGNRQALGGGLNYVQFNVGGKSTRVVEPTLALRLGAPDSGGRGVLIADLKPIPTRNPVWDESVSTLFVLPSLEAVGAPVGVRIGLGPTFSIWSGNTTVGGMSWGVAAGGALSLDLRHEGRRSWSVELSGTLTGDSDTSGFIGGLQLLRYLR